MIRAFRNRLRGGEGEDGAAPVVSIVLPVCNGMPLLRQAIRSVLRQRFRDFELIVVDRGSTDGTLGYLARVRDPRVRAIHDAGDLGLPEALSRGLAAARGEYAAWTSHDDSLERDFLDVLVSTARAYPECAFTYAGCTEVDEKGRPGEPRVHSIGALLEVVTTWPGLAAFLWRREVMSEVGAFDGELRGAEVRDFASRVLGKWPAAVFVNRSLSSRRAPAAGTDVRPLGGAASTAAERLAERALARGAGGDLDVQALVPSTRFCLDESRALAVACWLIAREIRLAVPEQRAVWQRSLDDWYRRAVAAAPDFAPARLDWAGWCAEHGRIEEAHEILGPSSAALGLAENDPDWVRVERALRSSDAAPVEPVAREVAAEEELLQRDARWRAAYTVSGPPARLQRLVVVTSTARRAGATPELARARFDPLGLFEELCVFSAESVESAESAGALIATLDGSGLPEAALIRTEGGHACGLALAARTGPVPIVCALAGPDDAHRSLAADSVLAVDAAGARALLGAGGRRERLWMGPGEKELTAEDAATRAAAGRWLSELYRILLAETPGE